MIIKASQRGGARSLSQHLLNANDNEHIHVHEISGFVSDSLHGAFQEAEAISKGTRCKQFLFSVSLSPPKSEHVPIETFEDAARRIENSLKLQGQPRVLVFHEKSGRLHAHAVWSRIDAEKMRAINLPYFKNKLMEISKELYLENSWQLPQGHISRENRNPLNFTTNQWYQAKRIGENPKQIKQILQESWAISKTKPMFEKSLEKNGYYLAKGDRRGYVAVDWRGEVYSLSRWLNLKNKELRDRLGHEKELQSINDVKAKNDIKLAQNVQQQLDRLANIHLKKLAPIKQAKIDMVRRHRAQRDQQSKSIEERWSKESAMRQKNLRKGIAGFLQRITGKRSAIIRENETKALKALERDRTERDVLITNQLQERERLQVDEDKLMSTWEKDRQELKEIIFTNIDKDRSHQLEKYFSEQVPVKNYSFGHSM
jgi:hypothetical protein